MTILGVDLETVSAADLRRDGAWAYSTHPSTRVWGAVFGLSTGRGNYRLHRWAPGEDLPSWAVAHIRSGGPLLAHNAAFEHAVIANLLGPQHGWPVPTPDAWHDTAAMAAAANLPTSLEGVAKVFKRATKKDTEGGDLMRALSKAVPDGAGGYLYPDMSAEDRHRLMSYCETDVVAMLDVYHLLPKLGTVEQLVWRADRRINTRGVYLDLRLADAMARMVEDRKEELGLQAFGASAGALANAVSAPGMKTWLQERGIELPYTVRVDKEGKRTKTPTIDRAAVLKLLDQEGLDQNVRSVLEARLESGKATSLAKLKRIPSAVAADGRLRNVLHYCAAHTGRWASRHLQIHNLPKDKLGGARSFVESMVRAGDIEGLQLVADRPLDALSQMLRSVIAAPPGRELICADYSAIEARVVAWLAGQLDVTALFRAGEDVYVAAAAKIGSTNRQLGKVCVLALGYGMGVVKFATTAAAAGIVLPLKEARRIQQLWREANDRIVQFWLDLERAVRECVTTPGTVRRVGWLVVRSNRANFTIELPSGRRLYYWRPRIKAVLKRFETVNEAGEIVTSEREMQELQFFRPEGKGMVIDNAYGGKLVENVTQAVARDLLAEATVLLDESDTYDVVLHVHDSIAAEVDAGDGDVDEFCELISTPPTWAHGLPLKAEGYRAKSFRG